MRIRLAKAAAIPEAANELPVANQITEGGSRHQDLTGSVFFIGTATVLIRFAGFSVLTDPNFIANGEYASLGFGPRSRRLTEAATDIDLLQPLDLVVLSQYCGDHFDRVAKERLARDIPIITTHHAAYALRRRAFTAVRPLRTWESHSVIKGDMELKVTAAPARSGPRFAGPVLVPVMGSILEFRRRGATLFRLYVSGDTLLHETLGEILARFPRLDLALLHLGGTRVLGMRRSLDARQGLDVFRLINPVRAIPIHYNDYTGFKSPLAEFCNKVQDAGLGERMVYLRHAETYHFKVAADATAHGA